MSGIRFCELMFLLFRFCFRSHKPAQAADMWTDTYRFEHHTGISQSKQEGPLCSRLVCEFQLMILIALFCPIFPFQYSDAFSFS